jgi:hypothetical protein
MTIAKKPAELSAAQKKLIAESLCRMAEAGRAHPQITEARRVLALELMALNLPAATDKVQ